MEIGGPSSSRGWRRIGLSPSPLEEIEETLEIVNCCRHQLLYKVLLQI
jgi:hypothetical protein